MTGSPTLVASLPFAVAEGAINMATDQALMQVALSGRSIVRFYGWEPWCLSLGRNQRAPRRFPGLDRDPARVGIDVVRRPTGGRAVFHGPEVTYAFACPDRAWGGPRVVYRRVHRALRLGLQELGVTLDAAPASSSSGYGPAASHIRIDDDGVDSSAHVATNLGPSDAACFHDAAPGELRIRSRKLVGSAQWRRPGALLQHGSILLSNEQARGELAEGSLPGAPAGIGLDEVLTDPPGTEELVQCLTIALGTEFHENGEPIVALSKAAERYLDAEARRLEPRYRDEDRLWRERPQIPVSRAG